MKLKQYTYLILFALTLSTASCGVKRTIRKADKKYELGEYYGASGFYTKAYKKLSSVKDRELKGEVAFKMGDCYRLIGNSTRAELAFSNAIRFKYRDDIVFLFYAEMLRRNAKCNEAVVNYKIFAEAHPDNVWAANGILSCQKMREWNNDKSSRYEVKRADVLNSKKKASDFSPAFPGGDGDVLYFNSSRENPDIGGKISQITGLRNNDFFVARKNALGNWEEPTPVEGDLNTNYDEGTPSFTSDGKTMYFTRCRTSGSNAEIFKSTRAGAQWGPGEKVEILRDSTLMIAHPAISPDGNYLYFVSDMPGGYGGKDIWRVQNLDGKWGALENLGPDINTPGDEMFPFVRANGDLYFSSNGHPGFGGLDIFRATFTDENIWLVENMMAPINSNADDFGIVFADNDESGFFSSNRQETKFYDKLWMFNQRKIEYFMFGWVTDTNSEPLENATIRIVGDDGTNRKFSPQRKDGAFRIELQEGVRYVALASARGHLNSSVELSTVGLTDGKDFPTNFKLASISKPVQVNNIFYEFGKWTLTPDSEEGIRQLARLLTDNPNITMEIGAHTDMVGSVEANMELSRRRAQEVVNYLIREGIDKERLTAVGYGKSVPVVVSSELARQHPFLKEGDVLNEEFILSKSPQEQEIMNQINRRTEFKVLKTTFRMY